MKRWRIIFLLVTVILTPTILIIFIMRPIEKIEAHYKLKVDSLENVNRALKDSLQIFKAPLTPASLKFKLEFAFKDFQNPTEFAEGFTAVAIQESGSNLTSGACQTTNGLWGLHKRPRSEYVKHYYNNGKGETLSCYFSLEDAIMDLREWALWNAPEPNERFLDFIKRRGYNPDPNYYLAIERKML